MDKSETAVETASIKNASIDNYAIDQQNSERSSQNVERTDVATQMVSVDDQNALTSANFPKDIPQSVLCRTTTVKPNKNGSPNSDQNKQNDAISIESGLVLTSTHENLKSRNITNASVQRNNNDRVKSLAKTSITKVSKGNKPIRAIGKRNSRRSSVNNDVVERSPVPAAKNSGDNFVRSYSNLEKMLPNDDTQAERNESNRDTDFTFSLNHEFVTNVSSYSKNIFHFCEKLVKNVAKY